MPAQLSYPGVYVEEIPSGVRTITGVATSIAAFIGRAKQGPIDEPRTIHSFADYERQFGGLAKDSMMSFAVRDFFLNGGGTAVIVRLYHPKQGADETAEFNVDGKAIFAANPGAWGAELKINTDTASVLQETADDQGVLLGELFNLTVLRVVDPNDPSKDVVLEEHLNVTFGPGPRQLKEVLANRSSLLTTSDGVQGDVAPTDGDYLVTNSPTDGDPLDAADYTGSQSQKTGLFTLEKADLFNLLCLPPDWDDPGNSYYPPGVEPLVATYCEDARNAIFLVDPHPQWTTPAQVISGLSLVTPSKNSAIYFPALSQPDPFKDNQMRAMRPCGAIAGIIARTDTTRGLWKAPAGLDATLRGVPQLDYELTDAENGQLNKLGVNCLRSMPLAGRVVWGARTRRGADQLASEWKYLPVRRMALFLKESLRRGLQWVVHEPNDEPLWAEIRMNVDAFMETYYRLGAFQGKTKQEAYLVKCDSETTTQADINQGIVNIIVGFAPLQPAEFVIVKLQQLAGQTSS